jgi:hypothetical protein
MSCEPTNCPTCYDLPEPINACADGLLIYFPEGTNDIRLTTARGRIKAVHVTDQDTELGYIELVIDIDLNSFFEQSKTIKVEFLDLCGTKIEFAVGSLVYDCMNVKVSDWFQEGNTVIDPFNNCPPAYPTSI